MSAPRSRIRMPAAAAAAVAVIAVAAGCGSASGTVGDGPATVRGAVQGFLTNCALASAPRVVEQLNEPAIQRFSDAGGTLAGCQAVLPLGPGGTPTPELFRQAKIERVEVRGDQAAAVVRAADGRVARAVLESSPPGTWKLQPSPGGGG